jgi:hypothetical protein
MAGGYFLPCQQQLLRLFGLIGLQGGYCPPCISHPARLFAKPGGTIRPVSQIVFNFGV